MVPRRSTFFGSPAAAASARASGTRSRCRCTTAATSTTTARTSTPNIPLEATSSPLITEVTRLETPDVVPASPFALSRRPSSNRAVTTVVIAMLRGLPAITPAITRRTSAHSRTLVGSVKTSAGVATYRASAAR
jgi:hypothetical protein